MKGFKKVLFPVDLSEASTQIAPYVKEVVNKHGSELHMLFVARVFDYLTDIDVPHSLIKNFEEEVVKGGRKNIEEFADGSFEGIPFKIEVISGDAAEEILKYTDKEGIDLIIMGTHGRRGLDRAIFGSVAERVLRKSPVPVMTINPYRGGSE